MADDADEVTRGAVTGGFLGLTGVATHGLIFGAGSVLAGPALWLAVGVPAAVGAVFGAGVKVGKSDK